MMLLFNFNHEAAINSCDSALETDPECPMVYFLKSFCEGINYNDAPEILT